MSAPEAEKVLRDNLKKEIDNVLKEYTRGRLDKKVHIIDISYESLLRANAQKSSEESFSNYLEFITAVNFKANHVSDYLEALHLVSTGKGTCVLQDGDSTLLINLTYDTARNFITAISDLIPENSDYGVSYRSRNYEDIQASRKFYNAAGSMFLQFEKGKYNIKIVDKLPGSNKYGLIPLTAPFDNVKSILVASAFSAEALPTQDLAKYNNLEVILEGKTVKLYQRRLSMLDLGHGQLGSSDVQITPVGKKLTNLLNLKLSSEGKKLVEEYIKELTELHNIVQFEFKNTSDKDIGGYIVLSIQNFKRNNLLSVSEGKLLQKVKNNIAKLLPYVPGSNTMIQDAVELLKNKVVARLTGTIQKPLKPHGKVHGTATGTAPIAKPSTKKVSAPRKTVTVAAKLPPIRNTQGRFTSLASLQTLLNLALHDQIQRNMGTGNSKNVLNYRTGRFAESAQVTRMSQSREGMISAYYTYMRNPYGTFSEGGAQSDPKSRDPKLLISRSIREVLATQVNNRLRAVLA